ncbi:Dam family site-specific DNA-(adenine-N6)-methyltransferase [uncultured Campylobacter sp.]|uniref:DNA adenine methylase n=1 Tax=uncultured Campylobacter sp. TaxID=218934 RepID=UPI0026161060|nr:Dam family site-specific DNA-(adenine-N6)-methyltransferase [uncultured Campylobacter sp.]
MIIKPNRSPLFYTGDKYKLMPQLNELFPKEINRFIEPFVGGGSVFLNTNANSYLANDIDKNIIALHKMFLNFDLDELMRKFTNIINKYGLSFSFKGVNVPNTLKRQHIKTYYAKFNKLPYEKMRSDYNTDKNDFVKLYLLLIYGFNRIIRFNSSGDFNLPVGNVDFNQNVYNALSSYKVFTNNKDIKFSNMDYIEFLDSLKFKDNDYVYFDPPYLISNSEYNKIWSEINEYELYSKIDELHKKNIKFGITNLIYHKGRINNILKQWANKNKYKIYNINSNYISFNDNTIKTDSKEIFITNYI